MGHEIHIPYSQVEAKAGRDELLDSFLHDLETPRPQEELESVMKYLIAQIDTEKIRLAPQLESGVFDREDIITGDAPLTTPFDALKGKPEFIPTEAAAEALLKRTYNIWFLSHPKRIQALKQYIKDGYKPPVVKSIPKIDEATASHTALDFDDVGFAVTDSAEFNTEDTSARRLLADGPFTYIADNLVSIPYALSSMPDVSGSFSAATNALSGGPAFMPFDSIWSNTENKLKAAKQAWKIVVNDASLKEHPDKDFLLEHYHRLIGITIKANGTSVEEVGRFLDAGFTTFRIYDARGKNSIAKTIYNIKQRFSHVENLTLIAGQVTGPNQAHKIQDAGANAIIVGIGGGGICSTPKEAAIQTANINIGHQILRSGLSIPVLFDGGIGSRMPVVFAIGGAGGLKSSALVGGCIEQPPGLFYYKIDGKLAKNYSGEAAPRTKYGGGKTDFLGRPLFVEGADKFTLFNPNAPTMTDNTFSLLQSLTTAMIFSRVTSIQEWQQIQQPDIWTATSLATQRASVHHSG